MLRHSYQSLISLCPLFYAANPAGLRRGLGFTLQGFVFRAWDLCVFRHKELQFRCNLFSLREDIGTMPPSLVSSLISSMLYQRRFSPFFVSPVVAGLEPKTHKPFIAGFDCIGAACKATDFVANGTAKEQLAGICEAMWRPNMVGKGILPLSSVPVSLSAFCLPCSLSPLSSYMLVFVEIPQVSSPPGCPLICLICLSNQQSGKFACY